MSVSDGASHPARGAWIEIRGGVWRYNVVDRVAPRKGCVD